MKKITKEKALNRIINKIPKNSIIADFGCGDGYFLSQLKSKNKNYELHGFDIKDDPQNQDILYKKINLDGRFNEVESGKYNFVISQHTMEHLHNPLAYFSEMVRALKIGGYLFVETPSDRSTWASYPFHQELNLILSYYDDPTHIGRPWSPQSLYRLGCYHQLEIICSEYDSDWVSKFMLPINFAKFLSTKNTDKFVDDYWKALGWCTYAVFKKTEKTTDSMNYYSLKGYPHGKMGSF